MAKDTNDELKKKISALKKSFHKLLREYPPLSEDGKVAATISLLCIQSLIDLDEQRLSADSDYRGLIMASLKWLEEPTEVALYMDSLDRPVLNTFDDMLLRARLEDIITKAGIKPEHISRLAWDVNAAERHALGKGEAIVPIEERWKSVFQSIYDQAVAPSKKISLNRSSLAALLIATLTTGIGIEAALHKKISHPIASPPAPAELSKIQVSAYVFDLSNAGPIALSSPALTSEQRDFCDSLELVAKDMQKRTGDKNMDASNKDAFLNFLSMLNQNSPESLQKFQGPVLGQVVYDCAREHKITLLADILCYCPAARQIRFAYGTDSTLSLPQLLLGGITLGDKRRDVHAWSAREIKTLQSMMEKLHGGPDKSQAQGPAR